MEKIEIDKNKPLNAGDIIEMHFSTMGMVWLKATQIALLEWRMAGRKDFSILSVYPVGSNSVVFEIQVLKTNPVIVTAAVIGGVIISAGVVAWLTLDKVYQIIETPAGKAAIGGTALFVPALAIIAILMFMRK